MRIGGPQRHYIRPLGKIKAPRQPRICQSWRPCAAVVLVGFGLLSACAMGPRLESVAVPTEPAVTLANGGIRWSVLPNTWSAHPSDLARYFTPVQVRIENARSDELEIRYEDFIALDDGNQQYRAVPPGEIARAISGGRGPAEPARKTAAILLAGPWYRPYWPPYWGPYYGPYEPWWYPDPYYYPSAWPRPTGQDVLSRGLREGRLLAGASIDGFLYFQQATARGTALTLSWTPHLASGGSLPTLSAQFRIVR